jgi:hypothetical protein
MVIEGGARNNKRGGERRRRIEASEESGVISVKMAEK